jgi:hypothetical protein
VIEPLRTNMNRFHIPVMAVLLLAVMTVIGCSVPVSAGAAGEPFNRETPVVRAVRLAGPAVVNVSTRQVTTRGGSPFHHFRGDDMFERFFQDFFDSFGPREYSSMSLGSGVIIDGRKKIVLTNEHVVARAMEIKVSLSDEREFQAELIGADPDSDLAVLRIKADTDLPELAMGDSSDLMIGETVIAIGNPFGLKSYRDHGRGQRHGPDFAFQRPGVPGFYPDGCIHQSGQFRRSAAEYQRRTGGDQLGYLRPGRRYRFRHSHQQGQAHYSRVDFSR